VLLQEGRDPAVAERALREVLALDPQNAEVRHNLAVFLAESGRAAEGAAGGQWSAAGNGQGVASAPPAQPDPVVEDRGTALLSRPVGPDGSGEPSYGTNEFAARPVGPSERSPVRPLGRRDGEASPLSPGETGVGGERPALRLAFACYNPLPLQLDTPYRRPLGGSESALCYLAEALAGRGHQVFVLHPGPGRAASRGVCCLPLNDYSLRQLGALDAFVVLNLAGQAQHLRPLLSPQTALVLWTGHHTDQPAVQPLRDPAERRRYDGFALVSDWQRQEFQSAFGLDPARAGVLRNGIAHAFQDLFPEGTAIAARKSQPPVLAYTSTPYRGLDLLLEAFPRIRQAVPGTTLKVFSGMGVYQIPVAEDQARFGALYQRCRATDGVDYLGSWPQPELAAALTGATVLAYPNTYPETSCISVLEAMAAGCQVVTSARGALPETTAGFARLVPVDGEREAYLDRFAAETVQALTPTGLDAEEHLRRQVAHVHQQHTWSGLADTWVGWLRQLRASPVNVG
jgi:glycosyltransferase involved in cell wall biosynthesis